MTVLVYTDFSSKVNVTGQNYNVYGHRTNKEIVHCRFHPGTPCTKDSSTLGVRRRLGQDAKITAQQRDDGMTLLR